MLLKKIFFMFAAGLVAVSAIGSANLAEANGGYITLSNYYVYPSQSVSVSGGNFAPGETVSVSLAGSSQNVTADSSGKFVTSSFTVPYNAVGQTVPVTANGNQGHSASAALSVATYYPNVKPNAYYLVPGSAVQFSGIGFAPGESVKINSSGNTLGTATADGSGNFTSSSFTVPYASGDLQYQFIGQTSGVSTGVTVHISGTSPVIVLDNYYGYSGSGLRVAGQFFGAGEGVMVAMGGTNLGTATTTADGSFSLNATVPNFPAASVQNITASGQTTGKTASAQYTLAWNNQAGQNQNSSVTISVVSVDRPKANISEGQGFNVTPTLIATGGTANNVTVTVSLANAAGDISAQQGYANQTLLQDTPANFQLQAPSSMPAGTYMIGASVQNSDNSPLFNFPDLGTIVIQ